MLTVTYTVSSTDTDYNPLTGAGTETDVVYTVAASTGTNVNTGVTIARSNNRISARFDGYATDTVQVATFPVSAAVADSLTAEGSETATLTLVGALGGVDDGGSAVCRPVRADPALVGACARVERPWPRDEALRSLRV